MPKTMTEIGVRGIKLGFDIYAPETEPTLSPEPFAIGAAGSATRQTPAVGDGSGHGRWPQNAP